MGEPSKTPCCSLLSGQVKRSCPSCGPEPGGEEKKGHRTTVSVQLFPPELVSTEGGGPGDQATKGPPVTPASSPGLQVEHIISFLPVRDVVALGRTCHYFHEVCDTEGVWKRVCRKLSPRLREQGSGVRPWKRAAILNCTSPILAPICPYRAIPAPLYPHIPASLPSLQERFV